MAKTVEDYHREWQAEENCGGIPGLAPDEITVTPTSCIIFDANLGAFPGMSDGYHVLRDFGDAICYYRHWELGRQFGDAEKLSPEEAAHKQVAEDFFDALLLHFVNKGYQAKMEQELKDGVKQFLRDIVVYRVFVLPDDLPALLEHTGNPLVSWDEEESAAESQPPFNLNNPEHCEALYQRLMDMMT